VLDGIGIGDGIGVGISAFNAEVGLAIGGITNTFGNLEMASWTQAVSYANVVVCTG
jgi:uncharacterized membrane protein YdbT with pleckstrin-like domain